MTTWRDIRDLRAAPPALAGTSQDRREIFASALQQAEELARAATDVGYPTRPILLFYALSQAYRAVCAARLDTGWERSGHGLKFRLGNAGVAESRVHPSPGTSDLYSGAMKAAQQKPLPAGITIADLLEAFFEIRDVSIPGRTRRPYLKVRSPHSGQELADPSADAPAASLTLLVEGLPTDGTPSEVRDALSNYPSLEGYDLASFPTGIPTGLFADEEERNGVCYRRTVFPTEPFPVITVPFEGTTVEEYQAKFDGLGPETQGDSTMRIVSPGVGDGRWVLGPITPLWLLVFAMSSLARYYPSEWRRTLDIDQDTLAPVLERAIDAAESSIPFYVFHILMADMPDAPSQISLGGKTYVEEL